MEGETTFKNRRGWHLDKSINLPFLLSLALAGMAAIGYVIAQDRRQTKSEVEIQNIKNDQLMLKSDLKFDLNRIEQKLDRVIERSVSK